jgi:histidinol-phosphate aminotransferase
MQEDFVVVKGVRVRRVFAARRAYGVARGGAGIDLLLDANEGTPAWMEEGGVAGDERVRRYPSTRELEGVLAARMGVKPEQVLVTAGGDDGLERACRGVLGVDREMVLPTPTFEMLERYAEVLGADVKRVEWSGGEFPREAVLKEVNERTGAIAVVTPNNPTGAVASVEDVRAVCAGAREALVIVDAAYGEFADEDVTAEALRHENAVVIRTFSKAWGMAGLRVGYAIGCAEIIACLRAAGGPYSVSGVSVELALRGLRQGEEAMRAHVARVRRHRDDLIERLRAWGVEVGDSRGNFVLVRTARSRELWEWMATQGIAVRRWEGRKGLEDAVRITIPSEQDAMERLARGLEEGVKRAVKNVLQETPE